MSEQLTEQELTDIENDLAFRLFQGKSLDGLRRLVAEIRLCCKQLAAEHERVDQFIGALRRAEQRELEALAELDELVAGAAVLREALLHQLFDLHNHSSRPCATCERSRKALGGVEIGCGKIAPSFNHTVLQRALAAARAKGGAG